MLKNSFKLKQIALGLMIAGVTVGTALAQDYTASSKNTIEGHAPILTSTLDGAKNNTLHYRVVDKDGTVLKDRGMVIGDQIQILYKLIDEDGDTEGKSVHSASTAKFFTSKDKTGNSWTQITSGVNVSSKGIVSLTVNASMIGAARIGFTITPTTEYGAPRAGQVLAMGNIFEKTLPPSILPDGSTDPGTSTGGTGDNGGEGGGGINPIDPFPVPSGGLQEALFKVNDDGSLDYTINYHTDENASPRVGSKYIAALYVVGSGAYSASTVVLNRDKWTYYLRPINDEAAKAAGITDRSTEIRIKDSDIVDGVVSIKVNSEYLGQGLTDGSKARAGAQGYILRATADL